MKIKLLLCLCIMATVNCSTKFAIVVYAHNNAQSYEQNLQSIFSQQYSNYRVIYVDDYSSDETHALVNEYLKIHKPSIPVTIIRNKEQKLKVGVLNELIRTFDNNNEIVVELNGDDYLAHPNVLNILDGIYQNKNVWITCSQPNTLTNNSTFSLIQQTKEMVKCYRNNCTHNCLVQSPKTYYVWLFKRIQEDDLKIDHTLMTTYSESIATIIPMLEMAETHAIFIEKSLIINHKTNLQKNFNIDSAPSPINQFMQTKKTYKPLKTNFIITIASYNNKKWYQKNLESVLNQKYDAYKVIYIDDYSPDGTASLVEQFLKENKCNYATLEIDYEKYKNYKNLEDYVDTLSQIIKKALTDCKVLLIKNNQRKLALHNLVLSFYALADENVIVEVDGDDALAHDHVLETLNDTYIKKQIWLTYGQFEFLSNKKLCYWNYEIPQKIIDTGTIRAHRDLPTHLRTFKVGLFKKIKLSDLILNNIFLKMTWDVAFMMPMVEMAGNRIQFFKEALLTYNDLNILNDHKVDQNLQRKLNILIRSKPKYERLPNNIIFEEIYV